MNVPSANKLSAAETEASMSHQTEKTQVHSSGPVEASSDSPSFGPPIVEGDLGQLGKYRILKKLGRGGMGEVYLAFDSRLQRKIALKIMLPSAASNTTAKDRFLREARAAAQISSDYVVGIYEADEIDGLPYIALQFLQGYPLDEYLNKKGTPRLSSSLRIMRETALGLAAAHKLGFIHRDIKPANIWLEAPHGRVKILDFGLAKALESNDANELTRTGMIMGTPAYMAPEQGMGNKIDARADLFSLGCVLYRLATGKLPFDKPTLMGTLAAIATEDPIPAEQINPEVRPELGDLIRRMLAKKPENRPKDATEVANELERILSLGKTTIEKIDSEPNQEATVDSAALYPMEVTAPPNSSIIGNNSLSPTAQAVLPPKKPRSFWLPAIGLAMFGAFGLVFAQIIIKIKNKDGSETEIKVPEGAAVEVTQNNTTVTIGPNQNENTTNRSSLKSVESIANTNSSRVLSNEKKADPSTEKNANSDNLEPSKSPYVWNPVTFGNSPWDKLDPSGIPEDERFEFQPDELVAVIGSHAQRHWAPCVAVAINASETRAATSSTNGEVIVWDLKALRPLKRFHADRGEDRNPYRMRFAENDNQLELLNRSNVFHSLWDISDQPEMIDSDQNASLYATSASEWLESGRTLMLDLSETREFALVKLSKGGFEETTRIKLEPFQIRSNVMAASATNQIVYVASGRKLHRATVQEAQLTNDEELPIQLLASDPSIRGFSSDGKLLAIRDEQGTVCWDLTNNPPKVRWREKEGFYETQFSPCGRWVAIGGDNGLNLFQNGPDGLTLVKKLDEQTYHSGTMTFSRDGNRAILAGGLGFVRVWDLSTSPPKEIVPFDPTTAFLPPSRDSAVGTTSIAPSEGQVVVSPSNFGRTQFARGQLWDLTGTAPKPLAYLTPPAHAAFFSAGKDRVVTMHAHSNEPPNVYPLRDGRFSSRRYPYSVGNSFGMIAPDGRTAVHYFPLTGGQKTFEGWDLAGEKPQKKWSVAAEDFITANPTSGNGSPRIWLSADNRWIATQGQQDPSGGPWKLTLWRNDGAKPEVHAQIPIEWIYPLYNAAFSPDGRFLAHTPRSPWEIAIVDLTGSEPREINKFTSDKVAGDYSRLAFHPDGKRLAIGSLPGICILDVSSQQVVWEWQSPGRICWLGWAADGRHLVTHNSNHSLYVLRFKDLP